MQFDTRVIIVVHTGLKLIMELIGISTPARFTGRGKDQDFTRPHGQIGNEITHVTTPSPHFVVSVLGKISVMTALPVSFRSAIWKGVSEGYPPVETSFPGDRKFVGFDSRVVGVLNNKKWIDQHF